MKRTSDYLNEIARQSDLFYELTDEERDALKKCLLSIYIDVKSVCDKYGLTLMLGGGSVLGAVRHKGFIPWDDDFDMMMPREDFDKLKEVFEKELSDKYILSVPRYRGLCTSLYMQILKSNTVLKTPFNKTGYDNVLVDIYAIEKMPDILLLRKLKCFFLDLLRIISLSISEYKNRKIRSKYFKKDRVASIYYKTRCIIGFIFSALGRERMYGFFDKLASSSTGMDYCTIPTGRRMSYGECLKREVFFPVSKGSFEGMEVNLPHNPDVYLKNLYGDYMQIPPIERRERHFYTGIDLSSEFFIERKDV